jgi:hypothetical protein
MVVTIENITDRHVAAVKQWADKRGIKTWQRICKRAQSANATSGHEALRLLAAKYNQLASAGMLGVEAFEEIGRLP